MFPALRGPRVLLASLAATAVVATMLVAAPASAADTGNFYGTVSPSSVTGWDGLVTVEAHERYTDARYETEADPTTGAFSLDLPVGQYKLFLDYHGTGNFLDRFWGPQETNPSSYYMNTANSIPQYRAMTVYAGATISGELVGEGADILSPSVTAIRQGEPALNTPRVTFDSAGDAYVMDRVEPGNYVLEFGGADKWWPIYWPQKPFIGEATAITVTQGANLTGYDASLVSRNTIKGNVTIPAPYSGTLVTLVRDGDSVKEMYSEGGPYQFDDVAPGTYYVKFGYGAASALRDEWWKNSRTAAGATAIVVTAGSVVSGINATMEPAPDIRGAVRFSWTSTNDSVLQGAQLELLRESPAGSGQYVSDRNTTANYNGQYVFENVDSGKYRIRVVGNTEFFLRTTYWPSTTVLGSAGTITISDSRTADFTADVTMVGRSIDVVERIQGSDRFSTAVEATKFGFDGDTPVPVVYIANGLNYPDALAAGPAAIHQGGALLMVLPTSVPPAVMAELRRLDPQKIVIVGSSVAVSKTVENALKAEFGASNVDRVAGTNRYETSRKIAEYAFGDSGSLSAFIATGNNFPDALAAGPAAASLAAPVILVNGAASDLDSETAALLDDLGANEVFVLGSSVAVSSGIANDLRYEQHVDTLRLEGANRYETALAVVQRFFQESHYAFLATGTNFPDALGGGALAGSLGAPLYLTPKECLLSDVFVDLFYIDVHELYLMGSSAALSNTVMEPQLCG